MADFVHAVRRVFAGAGVRAFGFPLTAVLTTVNAGIVIAQTGQVVFGIVNTVATLGALLPFADLGLGAAVTTAIAQAQADPTQRWRAMQTLHVAVRRLLLVVAVGWGVVAVVTATGGWSVLLGTSFRAGESMLIGTAVALLLLNVPLGLGSRCLVGLDLTHWQVALGLTAPAWTLGTTTALWAYGVRGMAYVLPSYAGALAANVVICWVAWRRMRRADLLVSRGAHPIPRGLLAGSIWMLVIMVGLPLGLETGRLVLAHRSIAVELSRFGLGAQLYGICWALIATCGSALWPLFVRNRDNVDASLRLWWQMVLLFGAVALAGGATLILAGPWLGRLISQGTLELSPTLMSAFAFLLFAQAVHLPGGVLLTRPAELRWQAGWVLAMGSTSIVLAVALAPAVGGVGVAGGAGLAVLIFQFVPDLCWVPRALKRRPEAIKEDILADYPKQHRR